MQGVSARGTATSAAGVNARCAARFGRAPPKHNSPMDRRPPYQAYAAITGAFAGGLAVAGGLSRLLGRDPKCQTALDLVVLSAASFKAARTLARDEVTSFIREPFVRGHAHEGGEEPIETGDWQQAIGELVTCS